MRLFIDSGNLDEIQDARKYFNIEGVTTNPKLASPEDVLEILEEFQLPTSLQIDTRDRNAVKFAIQKHMENPLYNIKIPVTSPDIAKQLIAADVKVNLTLCCRLTHVIAAVNLGARYVSIFVGRMLDNFLDAHDLIRISRKYIDSMGSSVEIIAASIRNADHIELACEAGAHIVTIPHKVLVSCLDHNLTYAGLSDMNQYF